MSSSWQYLGLRTPPNFEKLGLDNSGFTSCSDVTGVASALLIWLEWIIGLIHCELESFQDILIELDMIL